MAHKIFRSSLVFFIGLLTLYQYLSRVDDWHVFDFLPLGVITAVAAVIFAWTFFRDKGAYSMSKNPGEFLPTIIGITILLGGLITANILSKRDQSPTKLYCTTNPKIDYGAAIDFREDHTYKLTIWSILGAQYYHGSYTIKDSVWVIDRPNIENAIQSNHLIIRATNRFGNDSIPGKRGAAIRKTLYQVDEKGNILDGAYSFSVVDK